MTGAALKFDLHPYVSDRRSDGSDKRDNGSLHIP